MCRAALASKPVRCGEESLAWVRVANYRFLDAMGEPVLEREFPDHATALAWVEEADELESEVQRVEYRGPGGDWRWAGPLLG